MRLAAELAFAKTAAPQRPTALSRLHPVDRVRRRALRGRSGRFAARPLTYVLQDGRRPGQPGPGLGRGRSDDGLRHAFEHLPLSGCGRAKTIVIPSRAISATSVQPGETVAQIAETYRVDPACDRAEPWNQLDGVDAALLEAVPPAARSSGGVRPTRCPRGVACPPTPHASCASPAQEIWPYGDGHFIWPVQGQISQGFHVRHRGLDIAADFRHATWSPPTTAPWSKPAGPTSAMACGW